MTQVGREAELQQLSEAWQRAVAGERQVVFVTGEAGLGKTTLVQAFLRRVEDRGDGIFALGQCLERRGLGEAYMPVLEALGRLCRSTAGAEVRSLLLRQAPTWASQLSWLFADDEVEDLQQRTLGATRERMLREIVDALEALAARQPLVLVLEDLHWSDPSTVDLLSAVARRGEPTPLLIIGTYRDADLRREAHPLLAASRELRLRGLCRELALEGLAPAAIEEYLSARLPGSDWHSQELLSRLRKRTGGNPLFLAILVESWVSQGLIGDGFETRVADLDLDRLTGEVPTDLQQMIELQVSRLEAEAQEVLEGAAVAPGAFSAAAVAGGLVREVEGVESICASLAREGQFLRSIGAVEWPDGTVAGGFEFVHELQHEVLYGRIPPARCRRIHLQMGSRLEEAYGRETSGKAPELAHHFVQGRDAARAVPYLRLAGEEALERNAHREAIRYLTTALEMLDQLPDERRRRELELAIQPTLAAANIATGGWAAPAAEQAYLRARQLGLELGRPPQHSAVLYSLATMYELRGEYEKTQEILEGRLQDQGMQQPDAESLLESYELLACTTFHQGSFEHSVENADRGLKFWDPRRHHKGLAALGENPGVGCHKWAGMALWFLGYPDKALERIQSALRLAREPSRFYSLPNILMQAAALHHHRREPEVVKRLAEESIETSRREGHLLNAAVGEILLGWALVALGDLDPGVELTRAGLEASRASGARLSYPFHLSLRADALVHAGRLEEAADCLKEALGVVRGSRSFFHEAEILRLDADLTRRVEPGDERRVEARLREALDVASRQKNRGLALRVATDLARLCLEQGRSAEARTILGPIYDWFSEGFDTVDLRAARAVLEALV